MNKNIPKLVRNVLLLLTCLFVFTACPEDNDPDYVKVDNVALQFGWQKGSQQVITVESNTSWVMEGPNGRINWLSATVTTGISGTSSVVLTTTQDNPDETPRTETILFTAGDDSKMISATQAGREITYFMNVSPNALLFEKQESSKELFIGTNDAWTVVSSDSTWCKVSKTSNNSAKVFVTDNQNTANREAVVTVTGTKGKITSLVKVTQRGDSDFDMSDFDNDTDIDDNVEITFDVSPQDYLLEADAQKKTIQITGNDDWKAQINDDWCEWHTQVGNSKTISGSATTTLTLNVEKNLSMNQRSTSILFIGEFTGKTITVNIVQKGTDYYLDLDSSPLDFESAGGTRSLEISSNDSWNAKTTASWCQVSPTNGNGNGKLQVNTNKNNQPQEREATIIVKASSSGITYNITVIQKGAKGFDRDDFDSDKVID